ncbi:acetyltransferase (GNAT) family protein [Homoserinimonas aerilata]|uniref:Acetyltransferase (GNAT) family protein n=1 Tax=Homoserinimonas aerilata TaxID=1162970 RepID=A0A542YLA0_9MICO|nr:GNAT family N-acetyltransferase [Homoserinimonas aerilata]TQL48860.1 acetyltransferase (GNAT) family protein [Homoserinimonas aerilata]
MGEIRQATAADAAALHEVAAATFALACPPGTSEADVAEFITLHLSEQRFADYLADPARQLFVWDAGERLEGAVLINGYTMLVHGEPHDPDVAGAVSLRPTAELSKIYVRPDAHGSGIATQLMQATVGAARDAGAASVWLGVNQQNARANRFYEKSGFALVGTKRFLVGAEWHDDFVREFVL